MSKAAQSSPVRLAFPAFCLLPVVSAVLMAQPGLFDYPASGLLHDAVSRTIRPILGVPGSAYLGSPVLSDVESAAIAPGGRWVFAGLRDNTALLHSRANRVLAEEPIDGILEHIERIAWSPDGLAAVVHSPSRGAIQRISFRDDRALAGRPLEDVSLGGRTTALAVESTSGKIAAGFDRGLYLFTGDGPPIPLALETRVQTAVFSPDGSMLAAIDSSTGQVQVFRGLPPVIETISFSSEPSQPQGVAFSADSGRLIVPDAACACLWIYELAARRVVDQIALDAPPTCLEPLNGSSVYLLRRSQPVMVLQLSPVPAVFLVPAQEPEGL